MYAEIYLKGGVLVTVVTEYTTRFRYKPLVVEHEGFVPGTSWTEVLGFTRTWAGENSRSRVSRVRLTPSQEQWARGELQKGNKVFQSPHPRGGGIEITSIGYREIQSVQAGDGVEGEWIHVFNRTIPEPQAWDQIAGQVCFSRATSKEKFYAHRRSWVGVLVSGRADKVFSRDVYSYQNEVGERVLGDELGRDRIEAWVRPAKVATKAIVAPFLHDFAVALASHWELPLVLTSALPDTDTLESELKETIQFSDSSTVRAEEVFSCEDYQYWEDQAEMLGY
jgi:hypothetical protein